MWSYMNNMYDKRVDIVMVTYLREGATTRALRYLRDRTDTDHSIILVDNGSRKEYADLWLNENLVDTYLPQGENRGLEAARNIGNMYANNEYVVHIDNDILVPNLDPDWLQQLIGLQQSHPEFAAIALRPQILVGVGPIFKDAPEVVENNVVGGVARLMKTEYVDAVGGWDNTVRNEGRGTEEWDICTKLRNSGFKVGYARDLWAYHMFVDDNWGYPEGMKFGRVLKQAPADISFDPMTMEPAIRGNE